MQPKAVRRRRRKKKSRKIFSHSRINHRDVDGRNVDAKDSPVVLVEMRPSIQYVSVDPIVGSNLGKKRTCKLGEEAIQKKKTAIVRLKKIVIDLSSTQERFLPKTKR